MTAPRDCPETGRTVTTTYRTMIEQQVAYCGSSLEQAIAVWDECTYDADGPTPGGIRVTDYRGDLVTRDGWIMHVRDNGVTYLHPRAIVAAT